MKQLQRLLPLLFLTLLPATLAAGDLLPIPEEAARRIDVERARALVDYLASDAMMGRNTPSPQLDEAAAYLAARFKSFGIAPLNGSYLDEFGLKQEDLDPSSRLGVGGAWFTLKNDFIPCDITGSGRVDAEVVFVGYGLSRAAEGYDDYAGIDVRGKVVLAIAGEPRPVGAARPSWRAASDAGPRAKMRAAIEHGAVGLLLVVNPAVAKNPSPYPYYWPSLYPNLKVSPPLRLDLPDSVQRSIPVVSIGEGPARALFGGTLDRAAALAHAIDTSGRPASTPLGTTIHLDIRLAKESIPARNVVGVVRGRLRPDEYVVVGAHYDHIGYFEKRGSVDARVTDTIYNGADDNASGTAGLMMMAEAFASLPPESRPARSVVFVAFSGEEKGLYGSRSFVLRDVVPTGKIVAMINMDMIGRNAHDSVSVAGRSRSPELFRILEEANRAEPMALVENLESFFFRSDQASFAARRVPVLFFSSGEHVDYHQVSDAPEKIDYAKLVRIARLGFRTSWLVAESPDRPGFIDVKSDDPNQLVLDQ